MKNKTNNIKNFAILLALTTAFTFSSCEKELIEPDLPVKEQEEIVNTAPKLVNPLSDLNLYEAFGSITIDISKVFTDADKDELTYSGKSLEGNVFVSVSGDSLTISTEYPSLMTDETIVITADDGKGGTAETNFYFSTSPEFSYRIVGSWGDRPKDENSVYLDPALIITYSEDGKIEILQVENDITSYGTYTTNNETWEYSIEITEGPDTWARNYTVLTLDVTTHNMVCVWVIEGEEFQKSMYRLDENGNRMGD